jgi:hypothetical protein
MKVDKYLLSSVLEILLVLQLLLLQGRCDLLYPRFSWIRIFLGNFGWFYHLFVTFVFIFCTVQLFCLYIIVILNIRCLDVILGRKELNRATSARIAELKSFVVQKKTLRIRRKKNKYEWG